MTCGIGSRAGPHLPITAVAFAVLCVAVASSGPAQAGSAALVLDAETGATHYAYRANAPHPPASLTKMMTIYMAFEALRDGRLKPGQRLKASRAAARQKPSRLGLRRGQTIPVEHAILALATKSANDASVVVAEAIAGSEAEFARRMTARARALGMTRTVFRNASGLHHPEQTTTARDMARLAVALIRDFPRHYSVFSAKTFTWRGRRYRNHNPMLLSYDGADGIKTGYIRQSGYNLAASARRDGHRLIGIVLGDSSIRHREWRMATILDHGFMRLDGDNVRAGFPTLPYAASPSSESAFVIAARDIGVRPPPNLRDAGAADATASAKTVGLNGTGKWSIQVGAYRSAPPAEVAAVVAADRIPGLLAHAQILVTQVVHGGKRMFRARLTGLSEGEARTSCRQLALHRIPCLAVADTGEFRTSSLVR